MTGHDAARRARELQADWLNQRTRLAARWEQVQHNGQQAHFTGRIRPFRAETDIFITPGYRFRATDGLMTNFHLPRSSLLMLVSAFGGRERVLAAYAHAVREGYRFYSYGDAMLIA